MPKQNIRVPEGTKVKLSDYDSRDTGDYRDKLAARENLGKNLAKMAELQELLYAESRYGLLLVLQGRDTSGKDGAIRHVMNAFNPQGCRVVNFRVPTPQESAHDFLWRVHKETPEKGEIVIFNRSHYEDVVAARVEKFVPKEIWKQRYDHINNFERRLTDEGTVILKFFLHISREEQKERLEERRQDPTKYWKFSAGDIEKRRRWEEYEEAYEDALTRCNTPWAPWHIIPADRKWFRNLAISQVIVDRLESLNMKYPPLEEELKTLKIE